MDKQVLDRSTSVVGALLDTQTQDKDDLLTQVEEGSAGAKRRARGFDFKEQLKVLEHLREREKSASNEAEIRSAQENLSDFVAENVNFQWLSAVFEAMQDKADSSAVECIRKLLGVPQFKRFLVSAGPGVPSVLDAVIEKIHACVLSNIQMKAMPEEALQFVVWSMRCLSEVMVTFHKQFKEPMWKDLLLLLHKCSSLPSRSHRFVLSTLGMGKTVFCFIPVHILDTLGPFYIQQISECFVCCLVRNLHRNYHACLEALGFLENASSIFLKSCKFEEIADIVRRNLLRDHPDYIHRTVSRFFKTPDVSSGKKSISASKSLESKFPLTRTQEAPHGLSKAQAETTQDESLKPTNVMKRAWSWSDFPDDQTIVQTLKGQGYRIVEKKTGESEVLIEMARPETPNLFEWKGMHLIRFMFHEQLLKQRAEYIESKREQPQKRSQRKLKPTQKMRESYGEYRFVEERSLLQEESELEKNKSAIQYIQQSENQSRTPIQIDTTSPDLAKVCPALSSRDSNKSKSETSMTTPRRDWKTQVEIAGRVWSIIAMFVFPVVRDSHLVTMKRDGVVGEENKTEEMVNLMMEEKGPVGKTEPNLLSDLSTFEKSFTEMIEREESSGVDSAVRRSCTFLEAHSRGCFNRPPGSRTPMKERKVPKLVCSLVHFVVKLQTETEKAITAWEYQKSIFYLWAFLMCCMNEAVMENELCLDALIQPLLTWLRDAWVVAQRSLVNAEQFNDIIEDWVLKLLLPLRDARPLKTDDKDKMRVENLSQILTGKDPHLISCDAVRMTPRSLAIVKEKFLSRILEAAFEGKREGHDSSYRFLQIAANALERGLSGVEAFSLDPTLLCRFQFEQIKRLMHRRESGRGYGLKSFWQKLFELKKYDLTSEMADFRLVLIHLGPDLAAEYCGSSLQVLLSALQAFSRSPSIDATFQARFGSAVVRLYPNQLLEIFEVEAEVVMRAFGLSRVSSILFDLLKNLEATTSRKRFVEKLLVIQGSSRTVMRGIAKAAISQMTESAEGIMWSDWLIDLSTFFYGRAPDVALSYASFQMSRAQSSEWRSFVDSLFPSEPGFETGQDLFWPFVFSLRDTIADDAPESLSQSESQVEVLDEGEDENKVLFLYPPNGSIEIRRVELERLNEKAHLNDSVLDFYLEYLLLEKYPANIRRKFTNEVRLFGSLLFQRWRDGQHFRFKFADHFSKRFWFVPCNFGGHWSLIVCCNMNLFLSNEKCKHCFLLHLDSADHDTLDISNVIASEIAKLYCTEKQIDKLSLVKEVEEAAKQLKIYSPLVPKQTNSFDCGLYTCKFMDKFLQEVYWLESHVLENPEQLWPMLKRKLNLSWFSTEEIEEKDGLRGTLRALLRSKVLLRDFGQRAESPRSRASFDCSSLSVFFEHDNLESKRYFWMKLYEDNSKLLESPQLVTLLVQQHAQSLGKPPPFLAHVTSLFRSHLSRLQLADLVELISSSVAPLISQSGDSPDCVNLCEEILRLLFSKSKGSDSQKLFSSSDLLERWNHLLRFARANCTSVESKLLLQANFPDQGNLSTLSKRQPLTKDSTDTCITFEVRAVDETDDNDVNQNDLRGTRVLNELQPKKDVQLLTSVINKEQPILQPVSNPVSESGKVAHRKRPPFGESKTNSSSSGSLKRLRVANSLEPEEFKRALDDYVTAYKSDVLELLSGEENAEFRQLLNW